jgi:hypothetical protein
VVPVDRMYELEFDLRAFSAPFLKSHGAAAALLGLLKPVIKQAIRESIPPELGLWAAQLPPPAQDGGAPVSLAVALRVEGPSFAELDAPLDSERGELARSRLGWSRQQAEAFVAFQRTILRASATLAPLAPTAPPETPDGTPPATPDTPPAATPAPPAKKSLFSSWLGKKPASATSAVPQPHLPSSATKSLAALALYLGRGARGPPSSYRPPLRASGGSV